VNSPRRRERTNRPAVHVLLLIALVGAACGGDGDGVSPTPSTSGPESIARPLDSVARGLRISGLPCPAPMPQTPSPSPTSCDGKVLAGQFGEFRVVGADAAPPVGVLTVTLSDLFGDSTPSPCAPSPLPVPVTPIPCLPTPSTELPPSLPETVTIPIEYEVTWSTGSSTGSEVFVFPEPPPSPPTPYGTRVAFLPDRESPGNILQDVPNRTLLADVLMTADPSDPNASFPLGGLGPATSLVKLRFPVYQEPLAVPTLVIATMNENFGTDPDAGVFIAMADEPSNLGYNCTNVTSKLSDLSAKTSSVDTLFPGQVGTLPAFMASFALAFATSATCATNEFCHQQCVRANEIPNLERFVLRDHKPFLGINGISAEDSLDSVGLIGESGSMAHFFNDRALVDKVPLEFNPAGGYFTLTTDAGLAALITDLRNASGTSIPAGVFRPVVAMPSFAGQLSAMAFGATVRTPTP
jgi:hypothetical protein